MDSELEGERWYTPWLDDPDLALQPCTYERDRALYGRAISTGPDIGPRFVLEADALPRSGWCVPSAGHALVNSRIREVLASEARPGDLRWLDTRIVTPEEVSEEYSIPMPPGHDIDVVHEGSTTRSAQGRVIRWVLDAGKLADRSVVWAPGVTVHGLSMRGRVVKRVLECGVERLPVVPTRVAG